MVAASGLIKLSINGDSKVFFADDDRNLVQFKELEAEYALTQGIGLALHAKDGSIFTEKRIAFIRELSERAWQLPYTRRVSSITNAQRMSSQGDELVIEDMLAHPEMAPEELRDRVMADPMLVGKLIAPDAETTLLVIIGEDLDEVTERADTMVTALKALVAEMDPEAAGLTPLYGGRLAIIDALSKAGKRDLATLVPTTVVVIALLLAFLLRSLTSALILVATPLLSAIAALGILGYLGIEIMALTANLPSIILMLGVAGFSHLVIGLQEHQLEGDDPDTAVSKAMAANAAPIALTFVTTALGFLMLNLADSPPLQVLGSLVALGGVLCLIMGFVGIPALIRLLKPKPAVPRDFLTAISRSAAHLVTTRTRWIAGIAGGLAIIIAWGSTNLRPNDYIPHFFDTSFALRHQLDVLEQELPAYGIIEFDVRGRGEGAVTDPAFVAELEAFEAYLATLPRVTHVTSVAEILRRLHKHLHADDPDSAAELPRTGTAMAQYLLLYEMSLPFGQDLTDRVSTDKSSTRVSVVISDASNANILALSKAGNTWLDARRGEAIGGHATGLAVMYSELTVMNVQSMIGGTLAALLLISLVLVAAFRSLPYGIVSLLPNLLPGALAFGVWGILVGEVGLASSVVGAVTLGIIVDDTIHMIWRYQAARKGGLDPCAALQDMFRHAGTPILVSSIVLTLGFLTMATSGFLITATLGQLSAIIITAALVFDWFLLAPLLVLLDPLLERKRANVIQLAE
ncbi:MAG: MMPL family transporter [Pseudomonadota bacterium]